MLLVKVFDEEHEDDLSDGINEFLAQDHITLVDIQYSCSICTHEQNQIYCFSALILYEIND